MVALSKGLSWFSVHSSGDCWRGWRWTQRLFWRIGKSVVAFPKSQLLSDTNFSKPLQCWLVIPDPVLLTTATVFAKTNYRPLFLIVLILTFVCPILVLGDETTSAVGAASVETAAELAGESAEHSGPEERNAWLMLLTAIALLVANGFFVAAEFALVKVRVSRVEQMVVTKRFFAKTALWLAQRLEQTLSACQLGITMASLALGWVGEPAIAALLAPVFGLVGVTNETAVHTISFIVGFTLMTALHLVVGEQAPKIFAIRRPETMLLWCALPMKFFYIMTFPLMVALNASTAWILGLLGMKEAGEHQVPYTEEEIRALLREAHIHGNLTRSEANLLDAVFEFDDMVCRRIMLPRGEADIIDINAPNAESIELIQRTKHSRYPVCDGSLDAVLGVLHVKDLVGKDISDGFDFREVMRPPKKVPESMQISTLLRHFRGTHQLMAFVLDEHGTVVGIVTLENVLEEIIGDVVDEFDTEGPQIVPEGNSSFLIDGSTPVEDVEKQLEVTFQETEQDTMSGLIMHHAQRIVQQGDVVPLTFDDYPVAEAKIIEVSDDRPTRMRVTKIESESIE